MADEYPLIEDLAFLSDCHRSVLIDRELSVVWMCAPRFDSPSVFASLLDEEAGHMALRIEDAEVSHRRYLPDSLVLCTEITTGAGKVVVTDALASGPNVGGHGLCAQPPGVLVRRIECTEGEVQVGVEFAPRPEYGLVVPLLHVDGDSVRSRGGAARVRLSCPWPVSLDGAVARARGRLSAGEVMMLGVEQRAMADYPPAKRRQAELQAMLDETISAWRSWSALHQGYEGTSRELVHHSGRVLYALTYHPTGALVAAATTSLPEEVGGTRNWDYRYTWLRDASWTMSALWVAACPDEASDFFDYLTWSCAAGVGHDRQVQIMFGVAGEYDLSERELPHLTGYAGSRPVRVGNDAWRQHQLDVYGELLDAAYRLREQLEPLSPHVVEFLTAVAEAALARWQQPDHGIWEVRGSKKRFLHSTLMCWVALDRAACMADLLQSDDGGQRWRDEAEEVRAVLLDQGWNDTLGAFAQYLDGDTPDASALMVSLVGFLPAKDPRVLATIDVVERLLVDERGLVRRYNVESGVDGLEGNEGSFVLCTFWLAQALARAGQVQRADAYFHRAVSYANDLGLMAEEVETASGQLLGNFPQAFSHVGLINAAWDLDRAAEHAREET